MRALGKMRGTSFLNFCRDIKVAHSIFALPFAFSVFFIDRLPFPGAMRILLLLLCMVTARSFAMGMNRFLDWEFDQKNPRTSKRMIPSGQMGAREMAFWTFAAAITFIFCTSKMGLIPLVASVPLLLFLGAYSYLKRITFLTHFYLGICLGLSPLAVQVALKGQMTVPVVLLSLGIACWTAGFDMLYSSQDIEFDSHYKLHSFPSRYGTKATFCATFVMFAMSITCWAALGSRQDLGVFYITGVSVIAVILAFELWLVRGLFSRGSSPHLNQAFFAVNGWVSVIFFIFVVMDYGQRSGLWMQNLR